MEVNMFLNFLRCAELKTLKEPVADSRATRNLTELAYIVISLDHLR